MNRAQALVNAMQALNDSVRGSYIPADADSFLTSASAALAFLRGFSFVVLTQLSPMHRLVRIVSDACNTLNVPLLLARSNGLIGHVRVQLAEHCVRDAHTDDAAPDLRLYAPFEELERYAASLSGATGNDAVDVAHIPFIVILARAVTEFRTAHGGALPRTREEKDMFADIVRSSRPSSCPPDAENYAEALRYANLRLCHASAAEVPPPVAAVLFEAAGQAVAKTDALASPSEDAQEPHPLLPQSVGLARRRPFEDEASANAASLKRDRARWWTCAAAVAAFLRDGGYLPLSGRIPDMSADTTSYVALQRVFAARAARDARVVHAHAIRIAKERDGDPNAIDLDTVAIFCKRVRETRVIRTRSLVEEVDAPGASGFAAAASMEGALDESVASSCAAPYYVALRAADRFEKEHARMPGTLPALREADITQMCTLVASVRNDLGVPGAAGPSWREITEEVVRYAGVETHCVAAFIGGVAAQEIIKIVTGQFVPIADSIVFNMANMTSVTFEA